MDFRETGPNVPDALLDIHRAAFGQDDEADLTSALLHDASAEPFLSLLVEEDDKLIGHVLFTPARLTDQENAASAYLLAPLAVIPDEQKRRVGSNLVEEGLWRLTERGVELVFVFGDPQYYGRFGFRPAAPQGYEPPYSLQPEYADGWMVVVLGDKPDRPAPTQVLCADAISKPEYWLV